MIIMTNEISTMKNLFGTFVENVLHGKKKKKKKK